MRHIIEDAFGKDGFPHNCTFGDGTSISDEFMAQIRSVLLSNSLLFDWEQGDVLLIDNLLAMHGREPFEGTRITHVYLA
ncbi:hypothetical protein GCM10009094_40470 [Massilia aurea]